MDLGADPPRMTMYYVTQPPPPPLGVPSQYYVTINFPLLVLPSNNVSFFLFVNLICPSQELMNQPVSMVCGHSACKACLEEMVSKSLQGNGKTCPLCRETITLRKMNTNLAVRAMIALCVVLIVVAHGLGSMTRWKITAPFVPSRLSRVLMVARKATDRMPWISTW